MLIKKCQKLGSKTNKATKKPKTKHTKSPIKKQKGHIYRIYYRFTVYIYYKV